MFLLVLGISTTMQASAGGVQEVASLPSPGHVAAAGECLDALLTGCTATFVPGEFMQDCMGVQVTVASCASTPAATLSGCVPASGEHVLGMIEVRDEDAVLQSLWELRVVDGNVIEVLIDLP